ncbi:hypothetical protein ACIG0D_11420 [Streptomyces sp. NPDC052773]|uniref:hypothetical protein n=1 Tax=Streptomyces sp. NPDC052773 TaxID=3365693 RepID=UPI0037D2FC5A
MRTLFTAATGLPTLLFTAALLVAACFWVLVAVRAAAVDSFDADANLDPLGMGGVPVAVALSLLSALAWTLALGAALLLDAVELTGLAGWLLRLAAHAGALFVAWSLTSLLLRPVRRLFARPLHRLRPDEPGLPRPADAGGFPRRLRESGRGDLSEVHHRAV